MNKPTKEQVHEFLTRGVDQVIDAKKLEALLLSGKQIRMYMGIDPTGSDIHIGHAIALRKMKRLQEWGHHVILLIGDFTAMIGDPTGKDKAREPLTTEQVLENAKDYQEQASKVLDFDGENPVEIKYNSHWLGKMSFGDVVGLASNFTVQQMLERDMFQNRLKDGKPISLHEFLYPLMQGYDSVEMDVDLEIGGSDQLFNILTGRTLKEKLKKGDEKHAMTMELLEGSDGRKMSKSYNNHIPITAEPNDMYGRVMSIQDDLIVKYFTLATDLPREEIESISKAMDEDNANPRDFKMQLARHIVQMYHSEEDAQNAEQAFIEQFQKGGLPEDIPEFKIENSTLKIVDALVDSGLCTSKSDARRMIEQGAVKINEETIKDIDAEIDFIEGDILQKGKRGFRKIKF